MNDFKILFLYPNLRRESTVPPSITLLSSILKHHDFKTDLFDSTGYEFEDKKYSDEKREELLTVKISEHINVEGKEDLTGDLNKKINKFNPDLIAVSATESTFLLGIDMLRRVKDLKTPVILGGVFATFAPERALSFKEIDMVCIGEGEETLLELCQRMKEGKDFRDLKGTWVKDKDNNIIRNSIRCPVDINKNPTDFDIGLFEDWRLYRPMSGKLYRMISVETHRGCPFTCTYCNSPAQNKMYAQIGKVFFRKKSMDRVREEIVNYIEKWKAEYMFFWADTFLAMTDEEIDEFCEMYSEFKLPFFIQTRIETMTEDRLKKLKNVGLHRLAVGIEQGNEEFRKKMLKKMFSNQEAIEKLKIPVSVGVPFSTFNIIGLPDETPELFMDTVELNRQLQSDTTNCSTFAPFYGSELREYAVQKGYMDKNVICHGTYEDSVLNMPQFPKEKINALKRVFAMYVKFPKERWPEIKKAEEFTSEGNTKWEELRKEFVETYFD